MLLSPFALFDAILSPAPDAGRVAPLMQRPYAHRGLHGGGLIENSMGAFNAAINGNFGIELDIQLARDGAAMVFHDDSLDRLTDEHGLVLNRTSDELVKIKLAGTSQTIPTLSHLITLVAGKVALLIEIKSDDGPVGPVCLAVRRALEGYLGTAAVMSFNPRVGQWFKDNAPHVVRGLVITERGATKWTHRLRGGSARAVSLWRAKPDFLAYDIRDLPSPFASRQRRRGLPVLTWTVRTADQERTAATAADEIIFERPDPVGP